MLEGAKEACSISEGKLIIVDREKKKSILFLIILFKRIIILVQTQMLTMNACVARSLHRVFCSRLLKKHYGKVSSLRLGFSRNFRTASVSIYIFDGKKERKKKIFVLYCILNKL